MRDLSKLAEQMGALTLVEASKLKSMPEAKWATPSKRKPKLPDNEGKVCDATILRLEEREGSKRENLRSPEASGHKHPVELAFNLGEQVYAVEHTRILPILIGDRTYDEIVRSDEISYWEFDPTKLQQLTKR